MRLSPIHKVPHKTKRPPLSMSRHTRTRNEKEVIVLSFMPKIENQEIKASSPSAGTPSCERLFTPTTLNRG